MTNSDKIAAAVNAHRIVPRLIVGWAIFTSSQVVNWGLSLPAISTEQVAFAGLVLGVTGWIVKFYIEHRASAADT